MTPETKAVLAVEGAAHAAAKSEMRGLGEQVQKVQAEVATGALLQSRRQAEVDAIKRGLGEARSRTALENTAREASRATQDIRDADEQTLRVASADLEAINDELKLARMQLEQLQAAHTKAIERYGAFKKRHEAIDRAKPEYGEVIWRAATGKRFSGEIPRETVQLAHNLTPNVGQELQRVD